MQTPISDLKHHPVFTLNDDPVSNKNSRFKDKNYLKSSDSSAYAKCIQKIKKFIANIQNKYPAEVENSSKILRQVKILENMYKEKKTKEVSIEDLIAELKDPLIVDELVQETEKINEGESAIDDLLEALSKWDFPSNIQTIQDTSVLIESKSISPTYTDKDLNSAMGNDWTSSEAEKRSMQFLDNLPKEFIREPDRRHSDSNAYNQKTRKQKSPKPFSASDDRKTKGEVILHPLIASAPERSLPVVSISSSNNSSDILNSNDSLSSSLRLKAKSSPQLLKKGGRFPTTPPHSSRISRSHSPRILFTEEIGKEQEKGAFYLNFKGEECSNLIDRVVKKYLGRKPLEKKISLVFSCLENVEKGEFNNHGLSVIPNTLRSTPILLDGRSLKKKEELIQRILNVQRHLTLQIGQDLVAGVFTFKARDEMDQPAMIQMQPENFTIGVRRQNDKMDKVWASANQSFMCDRAEIPKYTLINTAMDAREPKCRFGHTVVLTSGQGKGVRSKETADLAAKIAKEYVDEHLDQMRGTKLVKKQLADILKIQLNAIGAVHKALTEDTKKFGTTGIAIANIIDGHLILSNVGNIKTFIMKKGEQQFEGFELTQKVTPESFVGSSSPIYIAGREVIPSPSLENISTLHVPSGRTLSARSSEQGTDLHAVAQKATEVSCAVFKFKKGKEYNVVMCTKGAYDNMDPVILGDGLKEWESNPAERSAWMVQRLSDIFKIPTEATVSCLAKVLEKYNIAMAFQRNKESLESSMLSKLHFEEPYPIVYETCSTTTPHMKVHEKVHVSERGKWGSLVAKPGKPGFVAFAILPYKSPVESQLTS